ncbi:unnamed protein product [Spodoptera exigua]|nr:unnamed protein product [Spodoptera exigua]
MGRLDRSDIIASQKTGCLLPGVAFHARLKELKDHYRADIQPRLRGKCKKAPRPRPKAGEETEGVLSQCLQYAKDLMLLSLLLKHAKTAGRIWIKFGTGIGYTTGIGLDFLSTYHADEATGGS